MSFEILQGDCLAVLPNIATASIDAVITDPPYPEVKRAYGRLSVDQWWELMMGVCREIRRILKPSGSAVFILQPNGAHVGMMRGWLWEFMAWICRDWNLIQDAYWWNHATPPTVHCQAIHGLMRPSIKYCIWAGSPACYRNQSAVLIAPAEASLTDKRVDRFVRETSPSGMSRNLGASLRTMRERGGATPYNLFIGANSDSNNESSKYGHGAGTPIALADWWTRYIVPREGITLDPFSGLGTMGIAAARYNCQYVGIEKMPQYARASIQRLSEIQPGML